MCGYDPFWAYDWQQDVAYQMDELGIDNYTDYISYLEATKNDTQNKDYESKMRY